MTEQPQPPDPATQSQEPATEVQGREAPPRLFADPSKTSQQSGGGPAGAQQSGARPAAPPPWSQPQGAADGTEPAALVSERPEIAVGAAFAGGFVLAMILKRLAR